MARLSRFIIAKKGHKSTFEVFLTQEPDGLSEIVHKGWLWIIKNKKTLFYEMHFSVGHPLNLSWKKEVLAYCPYPLNTVDNILYPADNNEENIVLFKKVSKKRQKLK